MSTIDDDALFNENPLAQDIAKLLHSDFLRWWCGIYYKGKRKNFGLYTRLFEKITSFSSPKGKSAALVYVKKNGCSDTHWLQVV